METTEGKIRKQPKYWAISAAAIMLTAFVLVQPLQTVQADVSTEVGANELINCSVRVDNQEEGDSELADAPNARVSEGWTVADPIQMNTVKAGDVAKTVHAEKQVYDCQIEQGGIAVIVDVTIIAEIYENMTSKNIIRQQAEVLTCIKTQFNGELVNCYITIPEGSVVLTGCVEQRLESPIDMNTVNKNKIVKTIKAEKEIYFCDLDTDSAELALKKVDLVIFAEIWENLNLLPADPVIKKEVFTFKCVALIEFAFVEACDFSTTDDITEPSTLEPEP
jgi:hypothetical protein